MTTLPNPLKLYKRLATSKGRLEAQAFLVEGNKAIDQIITSRPAEILEILTVHELSPAYRKFPTRNITESQCRYISSAQTPQGIIAVVRMPEGIYSYRLPVNPGKHVLLFDDIQDPGNAGTLIRTGAAFGFSGVIMSDKCADPLSPKCVQATAGSLLSLWIRKTRSYVNLAQQLKDSSFTIYAADADGIHSPSSLKHRGKLLLALGNEAAGLSKRMLELADFRIRVNIKRENAESLNVATCGAILMYLISQA
jgi:TrmH family RNA methyltransferase